MNIRLQLGVGLIEVAVALLVLSISTLGLARGQLAARNFSYAALQRSEAVFFAASLMEQERSNPTALQPYHFSLAGGPPTPDADCTQKTCTGDQWGRWNRWHWWAELTGSASRETGGRAVGGLLQPVACVVTDDDRLVVRLFWQLTPTDDEDGCELVPGGNRAGLLLESRVGEG